MKINKRENRFSGKLTWIAVIAFSWLIISGCRFFGTGYPHRDNLAQDGFLQMADAKWSIEHTTEFGDVLNTTGGSIAIKEMLNIPYTLRFKAQMPHPEQGPPDFNIPQVWFSVDYSNELDRLAFALRGGALQSVTVYDFQQRVPPSAKLGDWRSATNSAYQTRFWRLPEPIIPGQWFSVEVHVQSEYATLSINDKTIMTYARSMRPEARFTFGDSWQPNKFRSIELLPASEEGTLPVRTTYSPEAIKYDYGPATSKPFGDWCRITDAVTTDTMNPGWLSQTAGARVRSASEVESRLNTLVALAHGNSKATFSFPLNAGRYVISVGVGDAQYRTSGCLTAPSGNMYEWTLSPGKWAEIRFEMEHKGGQVLLPMAGVDGVGLSICYLVVEPWKSSVALALSKPSLKPQNGKADNEKTRQVQREEYKPAKLSALNGRTVLEETLAGKWLFMPADIPLSDAVSPNIEDKSWHVLDVPAFWNEVGWWIFGQGDRHVSQRFILDELARTDHFTFNHHYLRSAYYRHWLDVPDDWKGQRVKLEFDAVASVCVLYLNGEKIGTNYGMFKPFSLDITNYIRPGEKNLLAMWVNNGVPDEKATVSSKKDVEVAVTMVVDSDMVRGLPRAIYSNPTGENGKSLVDRQGGIWQDVRIKVSKKAVIEDVWPQTGLENLKVDLEVSGASEVLNSINVQVQVNDDNGTVLVDSFVPWNGQLMDSRYVMSMNFENLFPHLWSPADPYLYNLTVTLKSDGQILDQRSLMIGFRTFKVQGNHFLLNEKPFRWLGANMGPFGLAPNNRQLAHTFTKLMKEGNQNATRSVCSPYPRVWLSESDQQGVMVSLEGTWSWLMHANLEIPSEESLKAWKEEWFALMRQLRGHPSIAMWTINNETYITGDNDKQRRAKKWNILQGVIAEMRRIDPTRPIVLWSGYSRKREQGSLNEIAADIAGKDDGDIDDLHMYAGTYQPSWIGNPGYWEGWLGNYLLPDRPMITQEAGTAYPNTDMGHQESSYIRTWHSQIWMGDGSYEYRNPMPFLHRQARLTKEQIEIVRRLDVAGWLAFCNGTWYNQVHVPKEIMPYPVHDAVRMALSPVLVSMDMRERNYFTGQKIVPVIFLRNDDLRQRDFDYITVSLRLKDDSGSTLLEKKVKVYDVPIGSLRKELFELILPDKLSCKRTIFNIELEANAPDGESLSVNEYDITICSENYVLSKERPTVFITGLESDSPIRSLLEKSAVHLHLCDDLPEKPQKGIWIVWFPKQKDLKKIEDFVQAGGIVIIQNPENVSDISILNSAKITDAATQYPNDFTGANGEVGNVVNARVSPLLCDMVETDIAWWACSSGGPKVYKKALIFPQGIPQSVQILMNHIPPHGYDSLWNVEYPLVLVRTGAGKMVVSTLNLDEAYRDPIAARFFINLLDCLENKTF
jgi:hypothetical protein